ncbi:hypothetical protein CVT26_001791 [Gymnopilus dilepis]|uniref:Fungal-type protein kinase domain-containing protein n=1 Tax=Gymnopilus dilepis TaxID=231916 RepID=A0A409VTG7_9AGAR|nr:hypothetical protein CVT26_001791 [Gymnopilus dilepis]
MVKVRTSHLHCRQSVRPCDTSDLELDLLRKAQTCGIDAVLKYFTYLILKQDSSEKYHLDRLIDTLESIRRERGQLEKKDDGATHDEAWKQYDTGLEDLKEAERVSTRFKDDIQNKLLCDLLAGVLHIANETRHKNLLVQLENSRREKNKKQHCPHFVRLCNAVLTQLKTVEVESFKSFNKLLDIKFQVNGPVRTKNRGTAEGFDYRPDFIISSYNALTRNFNGKPPEYDAEPPIPLKWPAVLLSGKIKTELHVTYPEFKSRESYDHLENLDKPYDDTTSNTSELKTQEGGLEEDSARGGEYGEWEEGGHDHPGVPSLWHLHPTSSLKRTRGAGKPVTDIEQPQAKKTRVFPTPPCSAPGTRSVARQPTNEFHVQDVRQEVVAGRVQCAYYALEMLSYSVGVHHAVNLLLIDRILFIWYYDRQGIVQSTGIDIFKDFPRFVALLFLFQRFSLEDWGIIPAFNPEAVDKHGLSNACSTAPKSDKDPQAKAEPEVIPLTLKLHGSGGPYLENYEDFTPFWKSRGEMPISELTEVWIPDAKSFLSYRPQCLAGRATAVMPAVGYGPGRASKVDMVCKISHPEVQRRHEGTTMAIIYKIAEEDETRPETQAKKAEICYDWNMFNHLPKFYFYGDVKGTSTHVIRTLVGCDTSGCRTMRIIGMKRLVKVTTLQSWDFVKAWLEGVICHAFLWKNHIEHGDPSLSNLMYDEDTKCGVLTDFDLCLLQWEPRTVGLDRTGTVPFMAIGLLNDEYWTKGKLVRRYHHELESFIWILPYVFLQYEGGIRKPNALVGPWSTSDYNVCRKEKQDFLYERINKVKIQSSAHEALTFKLGVRSEFSACWGLARALCKALTKLGSEQHRREQEAAINYTTVVGNPADPFVIHARLKATEPAANSPSNNHGDLCWASEFLWSKFVGVTQVLTTLQQPYPDFAPLQARLEYYKPTFGAHDPGRIKELQRLCQDVVLNAGASPA